jgi:hypothetical protein
MAPAKIADTSKGKALVDSKGMILYSFDKDAGGVEVHIANGYLLHQFLSPTINTAQMSTAGRPRSGQPDLPKLPDMVKPYYHGSIIANAGITPEAAAQLIAEGKVDAVAFGRMFLANPDLPARIRRNGPYNDLRYVGLYGGNEVGYTDYPALEAAAVAGRERGRSRMPLEACGTDANSRRMNDGSSGGARPPTVVAGGSTSGLLSAASFETPIIGEADICGRKAPTTRFCDFTETAGASGDSEVMMLIGVGSRRRSASQAIDLLSDDARHNRRGQSDRIDAGGHFPCLVDQSDYAIFEETKPLHGHQFAGGLAGSQVTLPALHNA